MKKNNPAFRVALCGVLGALMVVLMLAGPLVPFLTYAAPGIAGALLVPVLWEFGAGTAALLYIAVSLLSFFLAPSKESALFFLLLLGWYPILRGKKLQHIPKRPLRILVKLILFNVALCAIYALLLFVFVSPDLTKEDMTLPFLLAFLLLGNATFLLYDLCLGRLTDFYVCRIRSKLFRHSRF